MEYRLRPTLIAALCRLARLPLVLLAGALFLASVDAVQAQTPAPAPQSSPTAVSAEELERLVKTLESEADRKRLVEELKGLIAVQRGKPAEEPGLGQAVLATLSSSVERMAHTVQEIGGALLNVRRVGGWLQRTFDDSAARDAALAGLLRVLAVLALGAAAQTIVTLVLRRVRGAVTRRQGGLGWRIGAGLLALVLDALPVAAFAAAAYGSLPFLDPAPGARLIAIALVNAIVVSQAMVLLVRLILQPHDPALRLPRLSDSTAAYLYVWLRRFIWLAVIGYVALEAARLLGLPRSAYAGLLSLLGLIIAALLVMVVLQNRREVAAWLKRHREGESVSALESLRFRIADTWHVVAIVYVVAVYVVWLLRPEAGLQFLLRATLFSAAALVVAWLLERGIERLIRRWFSVGDEFKSRFPDLEARANRYLPLVMNVTRIAIALLTILAILFIWGVTSLSILIDEPGRRIVLSLLRIGGVVIGGLLLWELGGLALERLLTRVTAKGRMPAARVQTMLPVARYLFGLVLGIIVGMMLLSEIGIEIGPLLAGAGVVGLAIGLGAQTLVKDMIAGFSLIMEDALAVGDVVRIGQHSGVVEAMNIRSIRLRGYDGTVQTIPLGGVTVVENMTKDYSFAVVDVAVGYKEDMDKVAAVLQSLGEELQSDPDYAADILAPIEIVGVDKFQDSSILVKARIKTYPIKQWNVMREFNRRLKARFDKEGIELPFPYRTLTLDSETLKALKQMAAPPANDGQEPAR
ncbi:MAG: Mechanosensitive ion channel protein [Alphaproteobacteria bacterium]|jgi:small conductance mechanosensitive channel|nr:Mechanosensitive ion channel protein [Alphaproteobacteria bacterium]